jgi:hypothetical protein
MCHNEHHIFYIVIMDETTKSTLHVCCEANVYCNKNNHVLFLCLSHFFFFFLLLACNLFTTSCVLSVASILIKLTLEGFTHNKISTFLKLKKFPWYMLDIAKKNDNELFKNVMPWNQAIVFLKSLPLYYSR